MRCQSKRFLSSSQSRLQHKPTEVDFTNSVRIPIHIHCLLRITELHTLPQEMAAIGLQASDASKMEGVRYQDYKHPPDIRPADTRSKAEHQAGGLISAICLNSYSQAQGSKHAALEVLKTSQLPSNTFKTVMHMINNRKRYLINNLRNQTYGEPGLILADAQLPQRQRESEINRGVESSRKHCTCSLVVCSVGK